MTPAGRTKEAGGGAPPRAVPPEPGGARGGTACAQCLPWAAWDAAESAAPSSCAPSALPPNSFLASLEGNTGGVCCRHPLFTLWGIEAWRVFFPKVGRELVAEPKVPLALFSILLMPYI